MSNKKPVKYTYFIKSVLSITVFTILCFSIVPIFAEIQINPSEMTQNSLKLITISGTINSDSDLLLTITFPDDTKQEHVIKTTDGTFNYFINPDTKFPSGTFLVNVQYSDKTDTVGAFNIYDYKSFFDVGISRGSGAKGCTGCINPPKINVIDNSLIQFHNDDSAMHDIQEKKNSKSNIGLLLPKESKIIQIKGSGVHDYFCTIHPWVYFSINSISKKSGFSSFENLQKEIENILKIPIVKQDKTLEQTREILESITSIPCNSCFDGIVSKIIDGDTMRIGEKTIRLSLVNTPELGETGYYKAKKFTTDSCPVGTVAYYDIDDKQATGPYGRTIAEVFCGGNSLNEQLLLENHAKILFKYCSTSEFENSLWAKSFGCTGTNVTQNKPDDLTSISQNNSFDDMLILNNTEYGDVKSQDKKEPLELNDEIIPNDKPNDSSSSTSLLDSIYKIFKSFFDMIYSIVSSLLSF